MLKIGKIYKTIETPMGVVVGYSLDPGISENQSVILRHSHPTKSGLLVMVVQRTRGTSEDINDLWFKTISGDMFVWLHPYDLVEVNEEGKPIPTIHPEDTQE